MKIEKTELKTITNEAGEIITDISLRVTFTPHEAVSDGREMGELGRQIYDAGGKAIDEQNGRMPLRIIKHPSKELLAEILGKEE